MAGEGMVALTQMYGNRKAQGQGSGFSKFLNVKRAFEDAKRIQEYKLQEQEAGAYNDRLRQTQSDDAAMARQKESNAGSLAAASVKQENTPFDILQQAHTDVLSEFGGEAGMSYQTQDPGLQDQFNKRVMARAIELGYPKPPELATPPQQPTLERGTPEFNSMSSLRQQAIQLLRSANKVVNANTIRQVVKQLQQSQ